MKSAILSIFVIISLGAVFCACPNDNIVVIPYHACMQAIVDSIEAMPVLSPPGKIEKWTDASVEYYYVSGGCCDYFNYLYDTDCERICAPDGGITGNGDGNCPMFGDMILKETVWEDMR